MGYRKIAEACRWRGCHQKATEDEYCGHHADRLKRDFQERHWREQSRPEFNHQTPRTSDDD